MYKIVGVMRENTYICRDFCINRLYGNDNYTGQETDKGWKDCYQPKKEAKDKRSSFRFVAPPHGRSDGSRIEGQT